MVDPMRALVGCSLIFIAAVLAASEPYDHAVDVVVQRSAADGIFSDDFETGNVSRWSGSVGLVRTVTLDVFDQDLSCSVASSTASGLADQTCLTIGGLPGSVLFDCDNDTSTWYEDVDCMVSDSLCGPNSCCPAILSPMDFASFVWSCD
ncbi:MAG: hypothetical protein AAGE94_12865 [Acidobacteriota bacterium]